jgi:hypothetical protein
VEGFSRPPAGGAPALLDGGNPFPLSRADEALYAAKHGGRNQSRTASPLDTTTRRPSPSRNTKRPQAA